MAQLTGVNIEKLQGGLGRLSENTDAHLLLVVKPVTDTTVNDALTAGLVLTSLYQAEQAGINESLDANESVNLYEQVSDFFRLAPAGTLYMYNDSTSASLLKFLRQHPKVKGYAVQEAASVVIDTANSSTQASYLAKQQSEVIDVLASENRLIDFAVLGLNGFAIADAEDLRALDCSNTSVCVASSNQNPTMVNLGALLGMIAVRQVNENLGSVNILNKPLERRGTGDYPLTDANAKRWLSAHLTDGTAIDELDAAQLKDLQDKGYILASSYQGYAGVFYTGSSTAVDVSSDFAYIENNRTWNKAARIIRATLIPEVKGVVKKDPQTGFIKSTTVSRWQSLCNNGLERMIVADEISGFEVRIDHKQVVNAAAPVKVKAMVVADGIVHEFEVAVGLTNQL